MALHNVILHFVTLDGMYLMSFQNQDEQNQMKIAMKAMEAKTPIKS